MRNENEYEDDMTPEEAFQLVPVNGNKYLHIYFCTSVQRLKDHGLTKDQSHEAAPQIIDHLHSNEENWKEEANEHAQQYSDPEQVKEVIFPSFFALKAVRIADAIARHTIASFN